METYTFLRELADSWMLLAMFIFFVGVCLWVFRPSAKAADAEAAGIPFRNETRPADGDTPPPATSTRKNLKSEAN